MKYLRLLRYKNLLIIGATQYLMKYALVDAFGYASLLSGFDFALVVLFTLLMAGGGYAINDYFDVNVDRINRISTQVVGESIKRSTALAIHLLTTGLSVFINWYLAWKLGNYWLGLIGPFFALLLWFYSTHFKKMFVIGNVLIAFSTAFAGIVMVILFCLGGGQDLLQENMLLAYIYSLFAFLSSWIREIIKDLEDHHGDSEMGYETLAIHWGPKKANQFTLGLGVIMLIMILFFGLVEFALTALPLAYIMVFLVAPQTLFLIKLARAKKKKDYAYLSSLSKIIMVAGVVSLPLFMYMANNGHI